MIKVALLSDKAKLPTRATPFSAGLDLYSATNLIIKPQSVGIIDTDLKISLAYDVYGRIAPRSGLSLKFIGVGGGVIDADYIGEIKVVLYNHHPEDEFEVKIGHRIAQLILEKVAYYGVTQVSPEDRCFQRGRNEGFGSSGQ